MFSDTHFHFQTMEKAGVDGVQVLNDLASRNTFFGLDIGTEADDLPGRQACVEHAISQMKDSSLADRVRNMMFFAAGIWPSMEEINNWEERVNLLASKIQEAEDDKEQDTLHRKVIAIGECGLDHHWNPSGVDGRCESDFDQKTHENERHLFEGQLQLAQELNLPVVIHSRDAFEDTVDCLKNVGYHNGIIHCYSYGIDEARAFLDLGWYIAFGGGTTYTKKSKLEDMKALLRFVPDDRLLCETDSPYLAPVPYRGTKNTPVLIEEVYKFVSAARGCSPEELSDLVDENIKKLFLA